jgi:hypothetical protein
MGSDMGMGDGLDFRWHPLGHPDDLKAFVKTLQNSLRKRKPFSVSPEWFREVPPFGEFPFQHELPYFVGDEITGSFPLDDGRTVTTA